MLVVDMRGAVHESVLPRTENLVCIAFELLLEAISGPVLTRTAACATALKSRSNHKGVDAVDKDRVEGMGKQAKGAVKDAAGKMTGDKKMQAEGKAEKAEGKVQNTVGGIKDSLRETDSR